jgi:hypothetical protein
LIILEASIGGREIREHLKLRPRFVTSSFTQSWSDEVNEKVRTEALNASRRGFFSAIKDDKKIMPDGTVKLEYRVIAINKAGVGSPSNTVMAVL